ITIGDTISTVENPVAMEKIEIEEPTISMNFLVNKSPLNGREGKKVTSSLIEERLNKELETNVALKVNNLEGVEGFEVHIENMRREGFELAVSKPKVLVKMVDGKKLEPYEIAQVTCDDEFSGAVIQLMSERKGTMTDMHSSNGQTNIDFIIPTRGLIGIRQSFITKTRGTGKKLSMNTGHMLVFLTEEKMVFLFQMLKVKQWDTHYEKFLKEVTYLLLHKQKFMKEWLSVLMQDQMTLMLTQSKINN
ncbi:hypothetical protein C4B25_00560, partial [Mycoplasma todarodis]